MEKNYVTKEGLEKLKTELEWRKKENKIEIAQKIDEAKSLGDLSENAAYSSAREEQAFNEGRIKELEVLIKTSIIIAPKQGSKKVVDIGSVVTAQTSKGKSVLTIVGTTEANPRENKISNQSPVGKALLGKKVGDKVKITMPDGSEYEYKILNIK